MKKYLSLLLSFALMLSIASTVHAETEQDYVIAPQFENAASFQEGLAAVAAENGKWGFINKQGNFIVQPVYDEVWSFQDGVARVKNGDKWGLINKTGKVLVQPQYDALAEFSEGFAVVRKDSKYGYIDTSGTEIVPPRYDQAFPFQESMARVQKDGRSGFVDRTGREAIALKFGTVGVFEPHGFQEGLAAVAAERNGEWYLGFINKSGDLVIDPEYWRVGSFNNGLAWVSTLVNHEPKIGFIDKNGREITDLEYQTAQGFQEGLALVGKRKERSNSYLYGFIDTAGREVVPLQDDEIFAFNEGMAAFIQDQDNLVGFIDKTGNVAIEPQYEYDDDIDDEPKFINGLAKVRLTPKIDVSGTFATVAYPRYGFIDKTGKEVVPIQYENIGLFSEGLAWFKDGGNYGFVTATGAELVSPQYWNVRDFSEGLAAVNLDGEWGYIANPLTEKITAQPTNSKITINGKQVSFEGYNIKNSNYFKLRDLAMALNESDKQFAVEWDQSKGAINLVPNQAYIPAGGELAVSPNPTSKAAKRTAAKIYLDDVEIALTAYNIDGSNYFKLRDLGATIDFGVEWDSASQTIGIDTTKEYTE